jgi:hypothetical protein
MIPVSVVAWLVGLAAYEGWLRIAWGQSMGGDWTAVAFRSAVAFGVAAAVVYVPAMLLLRSKLGGYKPVAWFPLLASVLGVVPTAIITFLWGGGIRGLFSAEASIFYIMFTAVGAVFGLGYALNRRQPHNPPMQPAGSAGR